MKSRDIALQGITWDHPRGFAPMAATSQRFGEVHPRVEIAWSRRSLQAFADQPLEQLAGKVDLLVIDHPWVGRAAASGVLLPLSRYVPALEMHARESVGQSQGSYQFGGEQWALAIDAAAPVSAYRPDMLERHGGPPGTWDAMIALGRKGLVACPSIPLDVYGNFLNICVSLGSTIFPSQDFVVTEQTGKSALELLRELAGVVAPRFFHLDPIRTLDLMSTENEWAYCPFIYGYSNYARRGFAPHLLRFGEPVAVATGNVSATMLGGTGLAVSAKCRYPEVAVEYALFVASEAMQRGLYFESGGQPALRSAWMDVEINRASGNFFTDTLAAAERAFVRPRYDGYLAFQERAAGLIHQYLQGRSGTAAACLEQLNDAYRASLARIQEPA